MRTGAVRKIVEQKDASAEERAIAEINTGIVVTPTRQLASWLAALKNDNAQGEFYLTDVVERALEAGVDVVTAQPDEEWETLGVNSKQQLAELERIHQRNVADDLLVAGVTLADPARIDVRGTLQCGRDVSIDVNCVFEGRVTLADNVTIGPNCVIRDAAIGAGTRVDAFTHIEGGTTGAHVVLGPYARLRPGAMLGDDVHVGNFVEVKNAVFGHGIEGESPFLCRRLGCRRAREHRRGHDHVQLRRREQASHRDRRRRVRRLRYAARRAGTRRARRDDRGGHDGMEGRRRRRTGAEREDAGEQERLRAAGQEESLRTHSVEARHAPAIKLEKGWKTMCGIVGAVAQRNIVPVLVEGLRRLEYRGYDSCGVAVLERRRAASARAAWRAWPISTRRCATRASKA